MHYATFAELERTMETTTATKVAQSQYKLADFITHRWSPRAFSEKTIDQPSLHTILEAATWSYSANNAQPWEYYYAHRADVQGFQKLLSCLLPGNQTWAKQAAVLIVAVVRKNFDNGHPNPFAKHDLGAANANLSAQALTMGIYTHIMGGFDPLKTKEVLNLVEEEREAVVCIAMGYLGSAEQLEEPFLSRELAPRSRKAVSECSQRIE